MEEVVIKSKTVTREEEGLVMGIRAGYGTVTAAAAAAVVVVAW